MQTFAFILEILGTIAFAVSGAMVALKKNMDIFGVVILGINIPTITIPVRPGRNLAVILEIAAMNHRQKKMGYNTAEEFNKRLMEQMGIPQ